MEAKRLMTDKIVRNEDLMLACSEASWKVMEKKM
jgi:hypothetical protein